MARFFYDGQLTRGAELTLDKKASHHLNTVLRIRTNDSVSLFNGDGYDYIAIVIEAGQRGAGKTAALRVTERLAGVVDSPVHITLVQCVSRTERMDISLRQAVELGVSCIQPVYSRQSVKPGDEKRASKKNQHWQSVVTSACEQSGRSTLPALLPALPYHQWLSSEKPDGIRYVLSPNAQLSLTEHIRTVWHQSEPLALSLIVGPESGLDMDELNDAVQDGAIAVHMGQRVLRTETAGPAGIAILQAFAGDLL